MDKKINKMNEFLSKELMNYKFERLFDRNDDEIPKDHPFHWHKIHENPKGDHGECTIESNDYFFKPMTYHILHTGGFLRLCTNRGQAYWLIQNSLNHQTPDWKLHFSCTLDDIPKAWNILVKLTFESRLEIGFKVVSFDHIDDQWHKDQVGREITVYIYSPGDEKFKNHFLKRDAESDPDLWFDDEYFDKIYDSIFWFKFIKMVEKRFKRNNIRPNQSTRAHGDLWIPGCTYASLRNEAFVMDGEGNYVYPSNVRGYNAANQRCPIATTLYFLKQTNKNLLNV